MAKTLAKRFYDTVSVVERPEGWVLQLDGRTLKTPGKHALICPTTDIADLLRAEWDSQVKTINPTQMPVTRLLNVACERTPQNREAVVAELVRYAQTDLLCFREATIRLLTERQAGAWDKWLDWAARRGVVLRVAKGVLGVQQDPASLDNVRAYAAALDDLRLTIFVHLTGVYSSVILAMAVMERELSAARAFDLSRIDETYQIEMWGQDEEAGEIVDALRTETLAIADVLAAL